MRFFRAKNTTGPRDNVGQLALEALQKRYESQPIDATKLAVIEACARLTGASLAAAAVQGDSVLSPPLMEMIGRELVLTGNAVFLKRGLLPVDSWDIRGKPDPKQWAYRITINGPDTSQHTEHKVMARQVLHFRINCKPGEAWQGIPAWRLCDLSSKTAAGSERSAGEASRVPAGSVLPIPISQTGGGKPDQLKQAQELTRQLQKSLMDSGLLVLPIQTQQGAGGLSGHRIGPEPSQPHIQLRTESERSLAWACGVPPQMLDQNISGQALREAMRQFQHLTLQPLARLIEAECMAKGMPIMIDFNGLFLADLDGRTRALSRLVGDCGMKLEEARDIVGL